MTEVFRPCFVVPVFNHGRTVEATIAHLEPTDIPCIVVDDGSDAQCRTVLDRIAAPRNPSHQLLRMDHNSGKGAAVKRGLRHAADRGFTHALQIDADGQHDLADVERFLAAARSHPDDFVIGTAQYGESAPGVRKAARYLTHVWVWINTLSFQIEDSMCGFRVYPLKSVIPLLNENRVGDRMEFDVEILVRASWRGSRFVNVPTRVEYPADGVSHFRMVRDNVLISRMHAKLFLGLLVRLPWVLWRRVHP